MVYSFSTLKQTKQPPNTKKKTKTKNKQNKPIVFWPKNKQKLKYSSRRFRKQSIAIQKIIQKSSPRGLFLILLARLPT